MIKGSIPALITPFKNGDIDKNALEDLVEWQIDEGSNGLVAVGTTGESPTLSHEEHQEVIEIIVKKTQREESLLLQELVQIIPKNL